MSRKTNNKNEIQALTKAEIPERKVISCGPALERAVRRVEKEYACTTSVERMLAQQIGIAQVSFIAYSELLSAWVNVVGRRSSSIKGREIDALSKHIDRMQRQMTTAVSTLRQLKQPHLQVNVVAKNAFVAQNQQINDVQ